ncbi:MAG: elongation factor EF-2 [Methanobacteriota archaeon]|nr:MAG: elongation factor EF-2 [Euryarchaeota archaeon]
MGRREKIAEKVKSMMYSLDNIRNIGIVAHIDHGKTTLSDNLLAGAGMISEELAGQQLFLDSDELEQTRGITIDAANVSMVHNFDGQDYLINMIDTPGHVDFSGDVTRAMRAIDGVIVVVCAVEGVMPQTETVVRQAIKEKVKPLLFINKVDRLINELKVTPEEMQQRFAKIISDFVKLVRMIVPEEFKKDWIVRVEDGAVAFGSAYYKWAISYPYMQKEGITFKTIYKLCREGKQEELARRAPLHKIVLDMVIRHLPNPRQAQRYRVPHLWPGDIGSEVGRSMVNVDPEGPLAMIITDITVDKHAGEVATGRVLSGTIRSGQEVWITSLKRKARIQQTGIYMGPDRISVEKIPAGNIAAVTGLRDAISGETICDGEEPIVPFESIKHISEPVVTVAVEAKNMQDLPKLIEVLKQVAKEDPTISVEINEETGEHLLSGMGELHLEIVTYRIQRDKGVQIRTSDPIVVYRETVEKPGPIVEGKSPNKHNKFYMMVEPMGKEVFEALREGKISEGRIRGKSMVEEFRKIGLDKEEAKRVRDVYRNNLLIDMTRGIVHLEEVIELVIDAFHDCMKKGPLTNEPCLGLKVKLMDAQLHEDSIHRGPAQVIPAVRHAIYSSMMQAGDFLLEPKQNLFIQVPQDFMGAVTREIQSRRGQILDMKQEGSLVTIISKVPVAEMFGFAASIRSATEGRALWSTEHAGFEKLPLELQDRVIREIRTRKGLKPDPPKLEDFT